LRTEVKDFQVDQGKRRARRVAAEATVRFTQLPPNE